MKTDTLFYKLLEAQPSLLLRLARLDALANANVPYRFQSVELKEKAQRADGILLPDAGAPADAPVIVCEVQFWADKLIYTRLVSETALLHLQMPEFTRFQMVLLLRSRSIDTDAGLWSPLRDAGAIHLVYLDEVTEHEELFSAPEEQAAILLMHLTVTPEDRTADDERIQKLSSTIAQTKSVALQAMFRDLFVSLYASKYKSLSLEEIRAMINTTEIFDDIHESLAVQQYGQELAIKARSEGRLEGRLEGKLEGKIEGKLEGKIEGKLEGVPKLLALGLSVRQIADALELSITTIEDIQRRSI
jgi:predicted transposase/invertase (TIGR01784 family)